MSCFVLSWGSLADLECPVYPVRHGVVADEISYNATISACAKTDRWDMAPLCFD